MSQTNWRGDSTKQQLLRACESRVAADVLNIMTGAARKKAPPNVPMDSPERFYQVSMGHLAQMIGCCEKTVSRAVQRLKKRGFITIHYDRHSLDKRNKYQVHPEQVENWLQRMPLFEAIEETEDVPYGQNVRMEADKMSVSIQTKCPDGSGQNVPMYNASITSSDTSSSTSGAGVLSEIDSEKEALIDDCRSLEVSQELAEHYLAIQSRKTIRNGILYVRKRCAREKVGNPGGLLNRFIQRPWEHGHERDEQGVWSPAVVRVAVKRQRVDTPKPTERMKEWIPFTRSR